MCVINFCMFIDEVKAKLGYDVTTEFSVTVFGRNAVAVEGVKNVSVFSPVEITLRVKKGAVSVLGENLRFVEFGGTEAYIAGDIDCVRFS